MISKTTIVLLLAGLLLATGIRLWSLGQRDTCAMYLKGDTRFPASQVVMTGTRTIVVPCDQWLPRQPLAVQVLCLLELVIAVVFFLHWAADLRDWWERRRRMRNS